MKTRLFSLLFCHISLLIHCRGEGIDDSLFRNVMDSMKWESAWYEFSTLTARRSNDEYYSVYSINNSGEEMLLERNGSPFAVIVKDYIYLQKYFESGHPLLNRVSKSYELFGLDSLRLQNFYVHDMLLELAAGFSGRDVFELEVGSSFDGVVVNYKPIGGTDAHLIEISLPVSGQVIYKSGTEMTIELMRGSLSNENRDEQVVLEFDFADSPKVLEDDFSFDGWMYRCQTDDCRSLMKQREVDMGIIRSQSIASSDD